MNKKSANRQLRRQSRHRLKPAYAAVLLAFAVQTAQANPAGGSVVSGSASFATSGNTLTVTNTPGTIINWQGFSIGSNEITNFAQQSASSSVLNRVVGNDPSNILGTLRSNGRVFLINPNGIVFGTGAVVDVAGLVASTLNLSDADFRAGKYHFTEVPGAGNISNAGKIKARKHGQILLIAPNVENTGVITAPNGEILLAAGHSVDLVNTDDPNLRVNITAPAGDVTNVGQLIASSGSLGLFGTVVRNTGVVSADSATMQGGKIVFKASRLAEISGTVSATGVRGGDIQILGKQVAVVNGANVDASGINGGGTVLAGGDAHGANAAVQNAQQTFVSSDATIKADALQRGDGGKVVVWADGATQFNGNISARGGAVSGNGGWVEVSGKQWLGYAGLVNTTAANGMVGSLLLDPMDITISNAADTVTMIPATVLGGTTFADAAALTTSNLNITTLTIQLALSNVTVDTTSAAGTGVGSITVQDSIAWASANSLTLNATGAGAITVNAFTALGAPLTISNIGSGGLLLLTAGGSITLGGGITLNGGTFTANAGGATSDVIINSAINTGTGAINLSAGRNITDTGALNAGTFTLSGGTWSQVGALPTFTVNDFSITGGTFIRALGGDGSVTTPYQLTDIYGVQGIGSAGMLGNSYVLANDIDASLASGWNASAGFAQLGNGATSFTGQFDGHGHTISNLYIYRPTENYVGLFGYASGGSISNVGLVNAYVTGGSNYVGGLVGLNGGTISNSSVSGNVTGGSGGYDAGTGGLVGTNYGTIDNSSASGSVNGTHYVGGLVGYNGSTISNSNASNNVTGNAAVGGLAGYNRGTISNSYVSSGGMVWGSTNLGGLVGQNTGVLTNSHYNINAVSINDGTVVTLGGLYDDYPSNGAAGQFSDWLTHGLTLNIANYASLSGSGNNYTINSVQGMKDLLGFADNAAYTFTLAGNIDLVNNIGLYIPYLAAHFNGNNHTISNLNINQPFNDNLGLFGNIASGGSVSNVVLTNANVTGNSNVGALAGWNQGTISSSHVDNSNAYGGNVSGTSNVGGLVGSNDGTVSSSYIDNINSLGGAYVSGTSNVGGLAGSNHGTISSSYVDSTNAYGGSVSGTNSVGGLAGFNGSSSGSGGPGGIISNSYVNNGKVGGSSDVGGLVGYGGASESGNGGAISDSYFSGGTVNGSSYVGGLVGSISKGSIKNSHVINATVIATSNVAGGLVGGSYGTISGSYVSGGSVTGSGLTSSDIGGLAGINNGTIGTSHVLAGNVTGVSNVGGFAGSNHDTISSSYADGSSVSGSSDIGGLVGINYNGTIDKSYVKAGSVTGVSKVGGLVGQNGGTTTYAGYLYGGTISNSYVSTGTVVNGSTDVGGLAGFNGGTGTIGNSYVSGGTVSATGNDAGGLVGLNQSSISSDFADGVAVTGASNVGGLVGLNIGGTGGAGGAGTAIVLGLPGATGSTTTISNSYASGGTVSGVSNVGGLVGQNSVGMIGPANTAAYGGPGGLGGAATISNTYASGGTVSGSSSVGGLVGLNSGSIGYSYASNGVIGGSVAGGLVGNNVGTVSATLGVNFWNTTVATGVTSGIGSDAAVSGAPSNTGAIGMNDANMKNMANFNSATAANGNTNPGWDIANTSNAGKIWRIYDGVTMPLLTSFVIETIAVPTVIDEIVDITNQRDKRKLDDVVVADTSTGGDKQTLPMCN